MTSIKPGPGSSPLHRVSHMMLLSQPWQQRYLQQETWRGCRCWCKPSSSWSASLPASWSRPQPAMIRLLCPGSRACTSLLACRCLLLFLLSEGVACSIFPGLVVRPLNIRTISVTHVHSHFSDRLCQLLQLCMILPMLGTEAHLFFWPMYLTQRLCQVHLAGKDWSHSGTPACY